MIEGHSTRVACVGDSITRGLFVFRRHRNSYPSRLQSLLGYGYTVENFGVNGHAVQQAADRPYRLSEAFARSTAFEPDIALLMLGTNDARGDNWRGVVPFASDYRSLVAHYQSLVSGPRIWLLTPPALFAVRRNTDVLYEMSAEALEEICETIRSLAGELGCGLIDVHAATEGHPEAFKLDGVHPGVHGAALIANAVYDALRDDVA